MDINGTSGRGFTRLAYRPDIVGPFRRLDPRHEHTFIVNDTAVTGHYFFDPTVFRRAPDLEEGTLGRNVFDGPGTSFTAVSVAKRTPLHGSHEVEVRADILNLFKQINFTDPNVYFGSLSFGQVYNYSTGRAIQLSLRYRF